MEKMTRAARVAHLREWQTARWWEGVRRTAGVWAADYAEAHDVPLNSARGWQREAWLEQAPPWSRDFNPPCCARCGARPGTCSCTAPQTLPQSPPQTDDFAGAPRDRKADAAAGRAAAMLPRQTWRIEERAGVALFVATSPGHALHTCPRCGAQAHTHADLIAAFGARVDRGQLRPQSLCKTCKNNHKHQRRLARRSQNEE